MKNETKNNDNYTYFLTSSTENVTICKLHLCTWMFHGEKEYLECGLQIKCDDTIKESRKIDLRLWIPWITQNTKVSDLYPSLKESENARFIFNESFYSTAPFDDAHPERGVMIEFANRTKLCLVPVKQVSSNGHLDLSIEIPPNHGTAELQDCVYVRVMIAAPSGMLSFKQPGIAKRIYSYDIKLNEPRNQPRNEDFHSSQICPVQKAYCLHIIPSNFSLSFLSNDTFKNVRLLEKASYENYVSKIADDKHLPKQLGNDEFLVVFNKRSAKEGEENINPTSFFSVFEEESVGNTQVILAIVLNYVCSLFFYWISLDGQNQTPKLVAAAAMGIALAFSCWLLIRKQMGFLSFVYRVAPITIIIALIAWLIHGNYLKLPTTIPTPPTSTHHTTLK